MQHTGLAKIDGMLCLVEFSFGSRKELGEPDGWSYAEDSRVAILTRDLEKALRAEEYDGSPLQRWEESWG